MRGILSIERNEREVMTMYEVKKATKEIKGLVDVTMENTKDNAVELAAAWGLYARHSLRETYTIKDNKITFRMTSRTFAEWLDIIKSVRGE
jgi:hypothetical protein